jgi:amidohydrolase
MRTWHGFSSALSLGLSVLSGLVSLGPGRAALASDTAPTRLHAEIDRRAAAAEGRVIAWRHDLHQNPELGNREQRTSRVIAEQLKRFGIEVKTGVARTGVIGLLRGGRPGKVVALRADLDALPVTEENDLPYRSRVRTTWNGQQTGVMHACGHDMHMAALLGAAEVLAGLKAELPGTVKFIFQPAEEGPPPGEEGGAPLMIQQGVLESPRVDAIFALHVFPWKRGTVAFRPGGMLAANDTLEIRVKGRQTHAAWPWKGVDPVVTAAQIVLGLQTVVSRQIDLAAAPAVVSIATVNGGNRSNIIPEDVLLTGTIRTFDAAMQKEVHERIGRMAEGIASSVGASAKVSISRMNPVTFNNRDLSARMTPSLKRVAGADLDTDRAPIMGSEDFAHFAEKVPALYFGLGVAPPGTDVEKAAPNHSPRWLADDGALVVGVRALASLAVDYLHQSPGAPTPAVSGK